MSFLKFQINPACHDRVEYSVFSKIGRSTCVFFLMILCQILWNYYYSKLFGDFNKIVSHNDTIVKNTNLWLFVLLGPILEEVTFRYSITSYDKSAIKISVSFIVGYFVVAALNLWVFDNLPFPHQIFHLGISIVVFMMFYNVKELISENAWRNSFGFFYWGSILLFGLVHVPQFINDGFSALEIVRSTGSLLIGSFYLTYIRFKFGIVYSAAVHIIYNLIFLL